MEAKELEEYGYIYFFEEIPLEWELSYVRLIKIGYSKDKSGIGKRAKSVQVGNSRKIKFVNCFYGKRKNEKIIHKKFKSDRIRGEWFFPSRKLINFINDIKKNSIPKYIYYEIISLHNKGEPCKKISEKLGLRYNIVFNFLKKKKLRELKKT